MATSSSDGSCTAPADFHLSSEMDLSERLETNLIKCPLCQNARRNFYCSQCINNGDFMYSTSVYSEWFADKQLRLLRFEATRNQLEERCTKVLKKHQQRDKILCDIKANKEKNKILHSLGKELKLNITRGNQRLNEIKDMNSQIILRLPKHEERIGKLRKLIVDQKFKQEKQRESVDRKNQQLKKTIRNATKQLIKYIFPLGKVEPNKSASDTINLDKISCALADASGTSYVHGKWISDIENSLEVHYSILASTLPGSGDYSAYTLWVAENKDDVPGSNKEYAVHSPVYNVNAALTYSTQLINIIAYYLNVRLPYKLNYSEFCESELSHKKFKRKVARLNSNILHLCFLQNTNISVLHPMHTLQNIMHLLNTDISDLGRVGPVKCDPLEIENLYVQLTADLENSDESTSDEEDSINWEWETVPNVSCPEMLFPIPGTFTNQQSSNMQVNQSVAGGLVISAADRIASFWRGWTANK